jgi:cytochrome c oxidase subunit II
MHPPVRKLPPVAVGMVLVLAALLVVVPSALAGNGGIAPVTPRSTNAGSISDAWWFVTAFILVVFVGVEGLLIVFILRYRRRRRDRHEDGPQIHGATRLETMWTLIPVVILIAVATFVFVKLPGIKNGPSAAAAPAQVTIDVRGQQFFWQFTYPNGAVSIDRLRVPVDESVLLNVTAPDFDVIHSWWIPALGGKMDAIPGRMNHTWFKATTTGVFGGRCAELCGVQHADMLMSVEVMPRAAYDQWVTRRLREQESGSATRTLGQEEWTGACAKCHGLAGQGLVGGQISSSATLQDKASLTRVLRNGFTRRGRTMPRVGLDWSQPQIDALAAYVKERFGSQG